MGISIVNDVRPWDVPYMPLWHKWAFSNTYGMSHTALEAEMGNSTADKMGP
jgi:hypothetical protein